MKKNIIYKLAAKTFRLLTHNSVRKLLCSLNAEFIYRVHGLSGITNLVSSLNSDLIPHVLSRYGATIGMPFMSKTQLLIEASIYKRKEGFSNLSIGKNCFLGKGVYLDLSDRIILEDDVAISPGVKILTHASVGIRPLSNSYPEIFGPVIIRSGAWIGAGATILCGVTIGQCACVAAGSVVLDNVEPYTLVAGNPAKHKKKYHPK
jgi:acetyltransferase-like isoleucine patch superfamily enzyme